MRLPLSLLAFLCIAVPDQAQDFSCPVNSQACSSYQELLKARDEGVTTNVRYVCFRQFSDEFFVVKSYNPLLFPFLWYKWNAKLAQFDLNEDRQAQGWVQVQTFQNGVANDSTMPNLFAYGKWTPLFGELNYSGTTRSTTAAKEVPLTVTIDSSQVAAVHTYQAQSGKRVTYSLTIQRSTKRFVEKFSVQNSPKDGFTYDGRCVEIGPLPKLPEPPALTEDQQAAKAKLEYCSDSPTLEDKGYCASSYLYDDDYQEAQKKKQTKRQSSTTKPPKN